MHRVESQESHSSELQCPEPTEPHFLLLADVWAHKTIRFRVTRRFALQSPAKIRDSRGGRVLIGCGLLSNLSQCKSDMEAGKNRCKHHNLVRNETLIPSFEVAAMRSSTMKQRRIRTGVSRVALGVAFALLATSVACFSPVVVTVNAPSRVHSYSALPKQAETLRPKATARTHSSLSTPVSLMSNHRHSSADWLYNIRSIPSSTILKEVRHPVLAVFAWSTIVTIAHRALLRSASSATRTLASGLHMSGVAHSFLVSALGLLLVFRTNSAYQRFQVRCVGDESHARA